MRAGVRGAHCNLLRKDCLAPTVGPGESDGEQRCQVPATAACSQQGDRVEQGEH